VRGSALSFRLADACPKPATYEVLDCYGRWQGTFCEACADEAIGWLDRYEAGRRKAAGLVEPPSTGIAGTTEGER
jgi:hypothetical protein